jgi:predicted lipoprotein with Yx(FWY)xxD motif
MIESSDKLKARSHRRALLVIPAAAIGLAALAACSSSSAPSSAAKPSTTPKASSSPKASASASASAAATAEGLKTAKVKGVTVLTNAKGFTLYSFAPDTPTKSVCNGACAASWPPQKAPSTVKGPYTAIKRSDGAMQLTFHGHPLYTFTGDTKPGQANGNGVNAFGGLWHEVPASGAAAPSSSSSPSSNSGY